MNLLETWWHSVKIETFILGFSYNSFQNAVRVLPSISDWLRKLNLSGPKPCQNRLVVMYNGKYFWAAVSLMLYLYLLLVVRLEADAKKRDI